VAAGLHFKFENKVSLCSATTTFKRKREIEKERERERFLSDNTQALASGYVESRN
jgi:hypothetical protein